MKPHPIHAIILWTVFTTGLWSIASAFQSRQRYYGLLLVSPTISKVGYARTRPIIGQTSIFDDDQSFIRKAGLKTTPIHDTPLHRTRQLQANKLHRRKRIRLGILFAMWYSLSVAYNIFSKKVLNAAPQAAWTAAFFQMFLGFLLYVGPLWASEWRVMPRLSKSDWRKLAPVAAWHSLVHVGGVVSMGAGAVSFTYIVKASEPAISAALSAVILHQILPLSVYATLLPVMGGVALASVSELTFSWKAFNYAMMSNVASSARAIVGKKSMRLGENMDARNTYAILTLMSSAALLPVAAMLEGSLWASTWQSLRASGQLLTYAWQTLAAALFYYTYNEVAFLCLDEVSTVSHALANTLKVSSISLSE